MGFFIRPIIRAIGWSAHCKLKRYHPDGARRLRPYCRVKPLARAMVTPGSCRKPLPIPLHQGSGRWSQQRSIRRARTNRRSRQLCQVNTWCCVSSQPPVRQSFAATRSRVGRQPTVIESASRLNLWVSREPTCATMFGSVMCLTSVRHEEVLFCVLESNPSCYSALESERRPCWLCCTRSQKLAQHEKSCGCTRPAIDSITHSLLKSAVSCSH